MQQGTSGPQGALGPPGEKVSIVFAELQNTKQKLHFQLYTDI